MPIDLPGLEAFLSVANWGSFNRAAGHLNLTQGALSHRLKKLEESLGVPLLSRTTRKVVLTEAGLELLPVAQRTIHELSSVLDGLRDRGVTHHDRLVFGCLPTLSLLYIPSILVEFYKQRPQTTVQVYDNSTAEIASRVRAREAEFGVTIVSADSWDLEISPLIRDPFVFVCKNSHLLAHRSFLKWQELEGEPLVRISAEAGNRALIDEALGSRRELMHWRYEVQRVATALRLVCAGVGSTIVPKIGLAATGDTELVAVPLRNPSVARTLGIVARRADPPSPGALLLIKLIGDTLKHNNANLRDGLHDRP